MISLDNTYDEDDIADFEGRIRNILRQKNIEIRKNDDIRMKTANRNEAYENGTVNEDAPSLNAKSEIISYFPLAYAMELKFDGLGLSLTYRNGELVRALTRGNGVE